MDVGRMNVRITFYAKIAGQNEDGEVVDAVRNDVYTCWAEVKKTSVRDFKLGLGLEAGRDTKVFIIRYHPKPPFDNSMYVNFNNQEYKITEIDIDYATKDTITVTAIKLS